MNFHWSLALLVGLLIGSALGFLAYRLYRNWIRNTAEEEATEIVGDAKAELELQELEHKEQVQEIELELWTKEERELLKTEEHIAELEEIFSEKKQKSDNAYSQERQKLLSLEADVVTQEKRIQAQEEKLSQIKKHMKDLNQDFVSRLSERTALKREDAAKLVEEDLLREAQRRALAIAEHMDEEAKEHSEFKAKEILEKVLGRFQRAYSAERGIPSVYFEAPEQRDILVDKAGENLKAIAELTGCDVYCEEGMTMVGVAGFDPVRRELTRRVLERCLKEKRPVNVDFIKRAYENIKRELLATIKRDGDLLAKELRLDGLNPEIRQMMGSLRYRYSFTQNQYFHCGEVGWLCGLLALELRTEDYKKARRAGMLHDLGKAMDHELEGGHAVIGADFIQARGEAADIIHAVKAHHYDETPATDLAFLVIAADAISGARPGARRSTVESYNQKVTELESIAKSFDGVTDCYILNGGREVRMMVNGKRVDDAGALKISKEAATRIEAELSYPGQIKVVVVRETVVSESTRALG
ncbi:MAG: Rnase Y domain-containing protein [Pseudobdellovibrionaceae bacterium]